MEGKGTIKRIIRNIFKCLPFLQREKLWLGLKGTRSKIVNQWEMVYSGQVSGF